MNATSGDTYGLDRWADDGGSVEVESSGQAVKSIQDQHDARPHRCPYFGCAAVLSNRAAMVAHIWPVHRYQGHDDA
jgi:hypothetical protein